MTSARTSDVEARGGGVTEVVRYDDDQLVRPDRAVNLRLVQPLLGREVQQVSTAVAWAVGRMQPHNAQEMRRGQFGTSTQPEYRARTSNPSRCRQCARLCRTSCSKWYPKTASGASTTQWNTQKIVKSHQSGSGWWRESHSPRFLTMQVSGGAAQRRNTEALTSTWGHRCARSPTRGRPAPAPDTPQRAKEKTSWQRTLGGALGGVHLRTFRDVCRAVLCCRLCGRPVRSRGPHGHAAQCCSPWC